MDPVHFELYANQHSSEGTFTNRNSSPLPDEDLECKPSMGPLLVCTVTSIPTILQKKKKTLS